MTLSNLKQLEAIVKPAAHDILVPGFGKLEYTHLSLIHISEPTRLVHSSRMPSSA